MVLIPYSSHTKYPVMEDEGRGMGGGLLSFLGVNGMYTLTTIQKSTFYETFDLRKLGSKGLFLRQKL